MATYHKQHGLPVSIVRPSLVTGLAGLPYPGYCGNIAGAPAVTYFCIDGLAVRARLQVTGQTMRLACCLHRMQVLGTRSVTVLPLTVNNSHALLMHIRMCSMCSCRLFMHHVLLLVRVLPGPIGMGIAMAVGLFDKLESVAMVPTHVWDAVPGGARGGRSTAQGANVHAQS